MLYELLCKKHLTEEEHSEIVKAKPMKVVLEASEVLEEHGFSGAKDMKSECQLQL